MAESSVHLGALPDALGVRPSSGLPIAVALN